MKKKSLILIAILFAVSTFAQENNPYLLRLSDDKNGCAYINQKGDTIVPFGKYQVCFTDTARNTAFVVDADNNLFALDLNGDKLFEVFWFDNGPDPLKEGLFRIVSHGKIGFANENGKIMIPPKFSCAYPFKNGKAKVSLDCEEIREDEYTRWESDSWFYIDKKGNILKPE